MFVRRENPQQIHQWKTLRSGLATSLKHRPLCTRDELFNWWLSIWGLLLEIDGMVKNSALVDIFEWFHCWILWLVFWCISEMHHLTNDLVALMCILRHQIDTWSWPHHFLQNLGQYHLEQNQGCLFLWLQLLFWVVLALACQ